MKNKFLRSPLFYVGDKYKLLPEITKYFPNDINQFIEPFVGGGSVFLNVNAKKYLLNDLDNTVIDIHQYLSKQSVNPELFFKNVEKIIKEYGLSHSYLKDIVPNKLKKEFVKTYYSKFNKEGYNRLKNNFNTSDKVDLLKLYILMIYGFNRMLRFNKEGNFNIPVGNVDFNSNVYNALNGYFNTVPSKDITWHSFDFEQFFNKITLSNKDFIYLDPPYLITFSEYNKYWCQAEEKRLLKFLDKLNKKDIKFAISNVTHYKGKVNDIFLKWSKQYKCSSIKSNYIAYHDNSIKSFKEVLVKNY